MLSWSFPTAILGPGQVLRLAKKVPGLARWLGPDPVPALPQTQWPELIAQGCQRLEPSMAPSCPGGVLPQSLASSQQAWPHTTILWQLFSPAEHMEASALAIQQPQASQVLSPTQWPLPDQPAMAAPTCVLRWLIGAWAAAQLVTLGWAVPLSPHAVRPEEPMPA